MKVIIAKVDKVYFDEEADSVILPTADGQIQVLPHHEPLISILEKGTITVLQKKEKKVYTFTIDKGLVEVSNNKVTVIL